MKLPPSPHRLPEFLVAAKISTYAAGGADSSTEVEPLIPGSRQFEFREGDLLYRDIYFGEAHFAGQEVVYLGGTPIWSMCYSGGWTRPLEQPEESLRLARVLRAALRKVPEAIPYRGPSLYEEAPYNYRNSVSGSLNRFEGYETIDRDGTVAYRLVYLGGSLD